MWRWRHINTCTDQHPVGGTAEEPYQTRLFGGGSTVTTREALGRVGYLDPRFRGYGWGHVEWTERFRAHYANVWGLPPLHLPALQQWRSPKQRHALEDEANATEQAHIDERTGPWPYPSWEPPSGYGLRAGRTKLAGRARSGNS